MHRLSILVLALALLTIAACAPAPPSRSTPVASPTLASATPTPTTSPPPTLAIPTPTAKLPPPPTRVPSWQPTGELEGEFIDALAVSPDYDRDQTVLVSTWEPLQDWPGKARFYKSSNGGQSWEPVSGGLPDWRVSSIAFSSSFARDHTIVLGLGRQSRQSEGISALKEEGRVFRSLDGGSSWTAADQGLPGLWIGRLVLSPDYQKDQTILATIASSVRLKPASGALYRSEDGGKTWKASSAGLPQDLPATAVAFSPAFATDGIVFASTIYGSDSPGERDTVFKSIDRGKTWKASNQGVPKGNQAGGFAISPTFAKDGTVYFNASMCCGDPKGVYKSEDGGATWKPAFDEALNQAVSYVAISPYFPEDRMLLASTPKGVYVSTDRGTSWRQFNTGLPSTLARAVVMASSKPPTIFLGVRGHGVWKWTGVP